MLENKFKTELIKDLEERFPGCMVLHNDANEIQGIPDLTILYKKKWAALEGKKSQDEPYRPNQEYYIEKMNQMSYASMICPENRERVLNELQQTLAPRRATRVSKCQ